MDRKRKRQSGVEYWTASKCQRLLRPIASRIAPLRRNQYTINSDSYQKKTEGKVLPIIELQNPPETEPAGKNIDATTLAPTWLPSDQSKNCQLKKYSARHSNARPLLGQIDSPRACLVSLPTPFKARALRRGTSIEQAIRHSETSNSPCVLKSLPLSKKVPQRKDPFTRAPVAKQSVELQGRQNYEKTFELHQGVTDGFSLLLRRTVSPDVEQVPSKGTSSLLSMCLRKVPDYIQAEEDWRKRIDKDDDTDVSAEVYEELENLGLIQGHGWSGLREVVIAHGLKLIHEIIKDKLVATETRAELAKIPSKHGLHRESQVLLLAYAHSLPLRRPLSVDSRLFNGCLSSLTAIQPVSTRNEVFVRTLDALFSSDRLKLSWLATRDMVTLSGGMVRALASQSTNYEHVVRFLQGRISQVCTAELIGHGATQRGPEGRLDAWKLDRALTNTIVSIITVLTAMILIERNSRNLDEGSGRPTATESLLVRLSIDVLANLEALRNNKDDVCSKKDHTDQNNTVCFALLTSSLILRIHQDVTKSGCVSLRRKDIVQAMVLVHGRDTVDRVETMVERAASFLVDLSRCCGQSLQSDSQTYLESLVYSIFQEFEHSSDHEDTFLKQWAMESSLQFAKISATQRSRAFLENIEFAIAHHKPLSIQTTVAGSHQSRDIVVEPGLRWEEGLCEWIVASPVCTMGPRKTVDLSNKTWLKSSSDEVSDLDDSGYLSDIKATPAARQKTINMSHVLASPDMLDMEPRVLAHARTNNQETARDKQAPQKPVTSQRKSVDVSAHLCKTPVAVVKILKFVHRPALSHENMIDREKRPSKKRKSQNVKQASSGAWSLAQKSSQGPTRLSMQDRVETIHPGLSESEIDELATSCSKPHQSAPVARKTVPRKSSTRVILPIRRTSSQPDISDDELGF